MLRLPSLVGDGLAWYSIEGLRELHKWRTETINIGNDESWVENVDDQVSEQQGARVSCKTTSWNDPNNPICSPIMFHARKRKATCNTYETNDH
jgi:hypothetical protein